MCLVVTCVSVSTSKLLCTNRVRYFTCLHRTRLHCCASCIIAYRKTVAAVAALARGVKVSFEVKLCREMVVVRNRRSGSSFLSSNARPLLFLNGLSNICKPLARTNQFFTSCGVFCGFFFCSSTDFRRCRCTLLWTLTVRNDIRKTPRYNSSRQLPPGTVNVHWLVYNRQKVTLSFLGPLTFHPS